MNITGTFALAAVGFLSFACTASTDVPQDEAQAASVGEQLCANQSGVPAVMASFAVSVAKELHRWNAPADFRWNSTTGMLELTATGRAQCVGGICRNVQAILDMQKAEAYQSVTFPGGELFNNYALRSIMQDGYNRQVRCNAWQGEYTTNGCWVDPHHFHFNHSTVGGCSHDFFFWANTPGTSTMVPHPDRLEYQLYFAGYPQNPFLNYHMTSGDVIVDPTLGLTEGDNTSSGSCFAACAQYSDTSLTGSCCSCNGVTRTFSRSPFSRDMYLCK